jgi:hypothetical protein
MQRLFINGSPVDLVKDTNIALDISIGDLKEPLKKKRTSSRAVFLAGTQRTLSLLYPLYQLDLSELNDFQVNTGQRITAMLYEDDDLIFNGLFTIRQVKIDGEDITIEGVLFSNILEIVERLGDVDIAGLGWSEYDHELSTVNIRDSWDTSVIKNGVATNNFTTTLSGERRPEGFGYVYPLVDWGLHGTRATPTTPFSANPPAWRHNELIPMFYFKEIWEKILERVGISQTGFLTSSALFRRLILAWGGGNYPNIDSTEINARKVEIDFNALVGTNFFRNIEGVKDDISNVTFWDFYQNNNFGSNFLKSPTITQDDLNQFSQEANDGRITISRSGTYRITSAGNFRARLRFQSFDTTGDDRSFGITGGRVDYTLAWRVIGKNIFQTFKTGFINVPIFGIKPSDGFIDYEVNLDINTKREFNVEQGDVIQFYIECDGRITRANDTSTQILLIQNTITNTNDCKFLVECTNKVLVTGDTVRLSAFAPKMKAIDFFNSVITLFNLYVEDIEDNTIEVQPLIDYYQDVKEAVDWTDLVDRTNPIVIMPNSEIEAKNYVFKYLTAQDYLNKLYKQTYQKEYGARIYEAPSYYARGTKEIVLPYEITITQELKTNIGNTINTPRVVVLDDGTNIPKPYSGAPRIFVYKELTAVVGGTEVWRLQNTLGTVNTDYGSYPAAGHFHYFSSGSQFDLLFQVPDDVFHTPPIYTNQNQWRFYESPIREVTDGLAKTIKMNVWLNKQHIQNLDFSQLVIINGVSYKLNRLSYKGESQSTEIELIKVIKPTISTPDVTVPK